MPAACRTMAERQGTMSIVTDTWDATSLQADGEWADTVPACHLGDNGEPCQSCAQSTDLRPAGWLRLRHRGLGISLAIMDPADLEALTNYLDQA